jgi:hypothetical protein
VVEWWSGGVFLKADISGASASVGRRSTQAENRPRSAMRILLRSPDNDSRFFDCDFRAFFCQTAAQSDSGPLHKLEQ